LPDSIALYRTDSWEFVLPQGWFAEFDDDVHTVERENGVGALQISVYVTELAVAIEDLYEFSEEGRARADDVSDYNSGGPTGIAITFGDDSRFWRVWYLRCGPHMFHITYNCDEADRHIEIAEAEHIVGTLRMLPPN